MGWIATYDPAGKEAAGEALQDRDHKWHERRGRRKSQTLEGGRSQISESALGLVLEAPGFLLLFV
jgi:hypothetical protein